jgi:hypothetical protein
VFAANALLGDLQNSNRRRVQQRLEDRYREQQRRRVRSVKSTEQFSKIAAEAKDETRSDRSLAQRLQDLIEQSSVNTNVSRITLASALSAGFAFVVIFAISDPLLGIIAAAAAALPILYLMLRRKQHKALNKRSAIRFQRNRGPIFSRSESLPAWLAAWLGDKCSHLRGFFRGWAWRRYQCIRTLTSVGDWSTPKRAADMRVNQ